LPFTLNGTTREAAAPGRSRKTIPADLGEFYRPIADKVRELQALGLTLAAICDELNRLGYRTRTGEPWRHATALCRVLKSFR
jgi:hypothetical protein